jgi:hypothetical protein
MTNPKKVGANNARGGKREGAGRPPLPKEYLSKRTEIYCARVTPKEKNELKQFLLKIRTVKSD